MVQRPYLCGTKVERSLAWHDRGGLKVWFESLEARLKMFKLCNVMCRNLVRTLAVWSFMVTGVDFVLQGFVVVYLWSHIH